MQVSESNKRKQGIPQQLSESNTSDIRCRFLYFQYVRSRKSDRNFGLFKKT